MTSNRLQKILCFIDNKKWNTATYRLVCPSSNMESTGSINQSIKSYFNMNTFVTDAYMYVFTRNIVNDGKNSVNDGYELLNDDDDDDDDE